MATQQLEKYARNCLQKVPTFSKLLTGDLLTLAQLKQRIDENTLFANREHRERLIDQMIAVLHGNYVFANSHELQFRFDPITTLLQLRRELVVPADKNGGTSNWEFYRILTRLFNAVGDSHTVVELPSAISNYTGFVPLLIESYLDKNEGRERYFVSHVLANCLGEQVLPGDEVVRLNGRDVDKVMRFEKTSKDAVFSPSMRFDRRNLDRLTIIPLAYSLVDAERASTLKIGLERDGEPFSFEHMFLFGELGLRTKAQQSSEKGATELENLNSARALLFAEGSSGVEIRSTTNGPLIRKDVRVERNRRVESLSINGSKPVCYVRLFSLETPDRHRLVDELMAAYNDASAEYAGLIIDIRSSLGGSIRLAELLLARISGKTIEPVTAQMRNTWLNEEFCRNRAAKDPAYQVWADSIRTRISEGLLYSAALPFSRPDELTPPADSGRRLPVVLIVDQNTASAAEVFAAGFVDNNVGELIGTHSATAGACAHGIRLNKLCMERVNKVAYPFDKVSCAGRVRLSICRLLRAGASSGEIIEGNGVKPDVIVPLTRDDVLHGNRDLLTTAVSRLLSAEAEVEVPRRLEMAT
ncbi:MAG: S41 family peptidase [Gammaproteobacteria bacterium]|nr:S41 family peptidase [Gammaproteobacteria bacterium]